MEATWSVADRWFRLLDGWNLAIGTHRRTLYVLGIHVEDGTVWVQLSRGKYPESSLLLRIQPGATVGDVFEALQRASGAGRIDVPQAA
jgi:hypothetical protein